MSERINDLPIFGPRPLRKHVPREDIAHSYFLTSAARAQVKLHWKCILVEMRSPPDRQYAVPDAARESARRCWLRSEKYACRYRAKRSRAPVLLPIVRLLPGKLG